MSPVLEELIFRGLMSCVIYNRCRDPKPGCAWPLLIKCTGSVIKV